MRRRDIWARMDAVLPFIAMLTIAFLDMSLTILVKAAMNGGMGSIVYCAYHNALATLILFPFFIFHIIRNTGRPPLTFHILFRFFILGLLAICLCEVLVYQGISYTSPTAASAIANLGPGITFVLAVVFGMEKIDIRSSSSGAKLMGTIIALAGAMVFTFYQGLEVFHPIPSLDAPNQLLSSQPSSWVFGGLLTFIGVTCASLGNILQTTTDREYPDQQTIVFFMCLFGAIQCIAISPFIEPNPSSWVLRSGIATIAVVLGAVHSTVFRCTVVIWCLRKKGPVFVAMFLPLQIVFAITLGIMFLGDSLYLGSLIGAMVVITGFYTVMWGQTKEENTSNAVMVGGTAVANETGSSEQTTPLLLSRHESKC